jgi:hypothetical protein
LHDPHVYGHAIRSREAPRGGTTNRTGSPERRCARGVIVPATFALAVERVEWKILKI